MSTTRPTLIATDTASDASLLSPGWRNISIGSIGLCSMLAFEGMGVATGMPAVAAALDGMSLYALAFAGTLAASVVAMVWAGPECDRHGPFRPMAGGMLLFGTGLLISGLAGSMPALIIGRIIQGFGVGSLGVALYVATARAIPAALHPRLFAMFSSAWVVPALIGPAISGHI
ncbi:MAG: MFS transporter, partial [Lysobacterales bacterium]